MLNEQSVYLPVSSHRAEMQKGPALSLRVQAPCVHGLPTLLTQFSFLSISVHFLPMLVITPFSKN